MSVILSISFFSSDASGLEGSTRRAIQHEWKQVKRWAWPRRGMNWFFCCYQTGRKKSEVLLSCPTMNKITRAGESSWAMGHASLWITNERRVASCFLEKHWSTKLGQLLLLGQTNAPLLGEDYWTSTEKIQPELNPRHLYSSPPTFFWFCFLSLFFVDS